MKVLRITPSYASYSVPGSGLNAFYHSQHSKYKSYILTEERGLDFIVGARKVEIKSVRVKQLSLGKVGARTFLLRLIVKSFVTVQFSFKSLKYIHSIKPDVVHLYSPIYLFTGILAKLLYKSKLVISFHGTDGLRVSRHKFLRLIFRICDANLSLSHRFIEDSKTTDLTYLGNGFDQTVFQLDQRYLGHRRKYIVTVGNLRWQKNHLCLIDAFSLFLKQHNDYTLIIIGSGEEKSTIESRIKELNLECKVKLIGRRKPKEIVRIMNFSRYFVLSSLSEGSPKVVYEALACGLPVLSTDVGDLKSILTRDLGIVSDGFTKQFLAKNMIKLIGLTHFNPKTIAESVLGRSWQSVTRKLDKVYEDLSR